MSDLSDKLAALLQQGQQFAQGMSNSAASTVSAPVDGLSWLLRKAGAGNVIGNAPVGGSDWMAQQGLTRPTNGLAGFAGGLLGDSLPIGVAAKAPQIANGLLTMGERAAAPSLLNPQLGAIVYHGSPHTFDKFDMSKIGTGEGAQAYGHGLYLADAPETAATYKTAGIDKGEPMYVAHARMALDDPTWGSTLQEKVDTLRRITGNNAADYLLNNSQKLSRTNGNLYKVDLPDEHIAKMLDWDKPLSQQSPEVQAAFQQHIGKDALGRPVGEPLDPAKEANTAGRWLYERLQGQRSQNLASKALYEAGVPGIKYLDQGSRGAGAGTSNYVVFDDSIPKILQRNGK